MSDSKFARVAANARFAGYLVGWMVPGYRRVVQRKILEESLTVRLRMVCDDELYAKALVLVDRLIFYTKTTAMISGDGVMPRDEALKLTFDWAIRGALDEMEEMMNAGRSPLELRLALEWHE
jgi:hypothetical protein